MQFLRKTRRTWPASTHGRPRTLPVVLSVLLLVAVVLGACGASEPEAVPAAAPVEERSAAVAVEPVAEAESGGTDSKQADSEQADAKQADAKQAESGVKKDSTALEPPRGMPIITLAELPPEALETIVLIAKGGPFPYDKDGSTFFNRERILPRMPDGYYREYTVKTPGSRDRGARRIVGGEEGELYYTDDHYDSFSWIVIE
jgi:ribonuclease T1